MGWGTASRIRPHWLVLPLLVATTCEAAFPERFAASYLLRAEGATVGRTRITLAPAGNGAFVYESHSTPAGIAALVRNERVSERAEWQFHDGAMRSLRYRYARAGRERERSVEVAFDWDRNIAQNTAAGSTWQMAIPDGTLDKLTYVLALMNDLAAGKRRLEYRIADGGRLKTYQLTEIDREWLETAVGTLETVVVRRTRDRGPREITLWCAPTLSYLPVKIARLGPDGQALSMDIESIEGMDVGENRTSP